MIVLVISVHMAVLEHTSRNEAKSYNYFARDIMIGCDRRLPVPYINIVPYMEFQSRDSRGQSGALVMKKLSFYNQRLNQPHRTTPDSYLHLLDLFPMLCFPLPCFGFRDPRVTRLARLVPLPFSLSVLMLFFL
jgi:hypothetical protein